MRKASEDGKGREPDKRPRAVCAWTGGKDSVHALTRAMDAYNVVRLVHVAVREDQDAEDDAIDALVSAQADSIGLPLESRRATWETYEETYRDLLSAGEETHCVLGNVAGTEMRTWNDECCSALDLTPVYPLWDVEGEGLVRSFLDAGFKARVVKIDDECIDERWLGHLLDDTFLRYLRANNIHPAGEFGEYHTFTVDGPVFERPVPLRITGRTRRDGSLIAEVEGTDPSVGIQPDRAEGEP